MQSLWSTPYTRPQSLIFKQNSFRRLTFLPLFLRANVHLFKLIIINFHPFKLIIIHLVWLQVVRENHCKRLCEKTYSACVVMWQKSWRLKCNPELSASCRALPRQDFTGVFTWATWEVEITVSRSPSYCGHISSEKWLHSLAESPTWRAEVPRPWSFPD